MRDRYDVIVVGAGPAGSITAKTCAEAGLDVLLIEKRQEIGDPVRCAEGVGKDALKKHIEPDNRWIAAEVKGSLLIAPDGTEIKISEDTSSMKAGYVLERKVFDRALAQMAAMAGAEVMVKTRATGLLRSNGRVAGIEAMYLGETYNIKADIVIGADGIESKIGRWGGIDTSLKPADIETCAQFLVSNIDPGEYSTFYLGNNYAPGGYLWIFPKGGHMANVGIGILGSKSGDVRAISLLQRYIHNNMPQAKIVEMVVGGVPVSGPIEQTVTDGLMLVGDAARQSDPLTGGGITNAMDAGKMAGEVCIKAKEIGDYSVNTLKEYEDKWRATIGKELGKSLQVKNLLIKLTDEQLNKLAYSLKGVDVSNMALPSLLFILFKKNPKMLWELRTLFK
ncbi:geranylgeranyl reductase family protein [Candidatus Methanoperedens nitroreducens]|uniref:Digeranylgeranylglycerophospholipid reductase n=1 Tax=Candidatus Methanoperedens nitratireducens TaxID=1392998 RepID=A0A062UTD5_9EURY|nr:NAD(P)/FAD-dependent oxidoreductase [Candidatus Methanoperedens nitroreducens]KCZ70311.1 geranylgeranyl reductase family protein [Candidatus Methanoperedens nitroreducens]MDJ1421349.1 NAD(P)/FAD-dependent oxidoreductase [Candidatus Methanoperedens sp.]